MATVIDELMITMGLDGSDVKKGMKDVEGSVSGFVNNIKSNILSIGGAFAGLYAVQQTFTEYLSQADSLLKFSRAIGQNVEDIDAWGQAVKRSGGSAEGFQNSLKSLTVQLSKMSTTGKSRAGNILQSVGIDAGDIGRQRNAFEVLSDIADKMQGMSKEEAFGFGASLGLDSGTIMLLQQGRDGVADLVGKMKELGTITPDDTWVEDFNDSIDDIKKSFMSLMGIVFREVGPVFNWLTQQIKQLNIWLRKHEVAVKAFFYMVAGLITALLIPTLLELFATILANPITWIIMLLAGLALAIEDLVVWSEGGESALGDLWEAIFGSPEEAKQTFEDIKQTLIDIWETVQPLIKSFKEWWQTLEMGDKIFASISPFGMLFELGQLAIDAFIDYAMGKFGEFGDWINEQFSAIGEWIDGVFQSISDTASSVVSAIEGFFAGLRDSIMSLIGEAIDWAIGKLAELAAAVKSTPIIGGAIDYVTGGGGGTTNNTVSSKYNVIVNTNATDAEGTGRAVGNAMMGYNARMANGGVK